MYLTSFVHREELFNLIERWLCGRLEPNDGLKITQILIVNGFVVGETLELVAKRLLEMIYEEPFHQERIHFKGELRDALCHRPYDTNPRIEELIRFYKSNPDFFYREAPINGVMCIDNQERLLGFYRIKRPKRIAEKANRYIANWIFQMIQNRAGKMAEERAREINIPLERLLTSEKEMIQEFVAAEEVIAQRFSEGTIELDRDALTIHDVGGVKIVADHENLSKLEKLLVEDPMIRIVDKENYQGDYRAKSLILEIPLDKEHACRRYIECRGWEKYLNRGISESELKNGLTAFLDGAKATLNLELILSNFPDMVESELGNSIHEERIIAQRDNKLYKGYIPMNVEFLIEYLFAVGFSPQLHIEHLPIKLWGRYLPDTIISSIRKLYNLTEYELFY